MAKRKKEPLDTQTGALTHNPFAALGPAPSPKPRAEEEEPEPSISATFAPKVVVRREKKGRGGKTVTRITGITDEHRDALAARMKKALGCGAAIEGEDVILLGALVDRAADWLEAEGARVVRSN